LTIGFEFSATVRVGLALDTKGIREAVEQKRPDKALNSFGFIDTFDGVDEPLIALTGAVTLDVACNAAIVQVGVSGSVGFIATVDFFDPFPETSGGLVRPYELLVLGSTPDQWFEFSFEIFVAFSVYIRIGLFVGFIRITLFELEEGFEITLLGPIFRQPRGPPALIELDPSGTLGLGDAVVGGNGITCTSLAGVLGDEAVECFTGNQFRQVEGVKKISFDNGSGSGVPVLLQNIKSSTDLTGLRISELTLDYVSQGGTIISDDSITVERDEVLLGSANLSFDPTTVGFAGTILLPRPEAPLLTTTFTSRCDRPWELVGHTNVVVDANRILRGCNIRSSGGQFNEASLTLDFATSDCSDGNEVTIGANGSEMEIIVTRPETSGGEFTITLGPSYTYIELFLPPCDRTTVTIVSTLETVEDIFIQGGAGDDIIAVGNLKDGLDSIHADITVNGGLGQNVLSIIDSASIKAKNGRLTSGLVLGLLPWDNQTLSFSDVDTLELSLSAGGNDLEVSSTPRFSDTTITAGDSDDVIRVFTTQGDLTVSASGGDDVVEIYGLGDDVVATIRGGAGRDTLLVDGRVSTTDATITAGNLLNNSTVRWSGGPGDDDLHVFFTSAGNSVVDIFDDTEGINTLNVDCADFACSVLSRENFLANIHDMNDNHTSVERINLDRQEIVVRDGPALGFIPTATVSRLVLRLNEGENRVYFDDTLAPMDVFGGSVRDEFRLGQLYNSERDSLANVAVSDPITTTLTTKGYLSNGNSHPVSISGGAGGDFFDVLRNLDVADLNGKAGDDTFVVRSFVQVILSDGTRTNSSGTKKVSVFGDEDNDVVELQEDGGGEDAELTAFVINSLVDVDGGTGTDSLIVSGTEADDSYVISRDGVFGGGLSIVYQNIENVKVVGNEGNDHFAVLSTSPTTFTSLNGNLGSDTFAVAPRSVDPVPAKNLRGHRGIIEHGVRSDSDPGYDGLLVEGVAVNILDNDGVGYINIVEKEAVHVITEKSNDNFHFFVYPTRRPQGKVVVEVSSQSDVNGRPYLKLNGNSQTQRLEFEANTGPRKIEVAHNEMAMPLEITDFGVLIRSSIVEAITTDDAYINARQSIRPINVRLLPAMDSTTAKSIAVIEPTGRTVIAEGPFLGPGEIRTTYDVYLRPCTPDTKSINVRIDQTVSDQLNLDTDMIDSEMWGSDCKATIAVTAMDDDLQEGVHFVSLVHVLEGTQSQLTLADNSTLSASTVLVRIYDDDITGVIVDEPMGVTRTAEVDDTVKDLLSDASLYEDAYRVRLSKRPTGTVTLSIQSKAVATDNLAQLLAAGVDLDESNNRLRLESREQVEFAVGGDALSTSIDVTFDESDWDSWKNIRVSAINDIVTEGVDLLHFPSQPSFLSMIQGPLEMFGFGSDDVPGISDPFLLPGENDADTFEPPTGVVIDSSSLWAIEKKQVDTLLIYDLDVRGSSPSTGALSYDQLTGFNMGRKIVIGEVEQRDGVVFGEMEVIEIMLGDGNDILTVESTPESFHKVSLGDGDDVVMVENITGPFLIYGEAGNDRVMVSSGASRLERINSLLLFDGGIEGSDEGLVGDTLLLDDSGDFEVNDVVNITRLVVEVESMISPPVTNAPLDSFLVSLRGAMSGSFELLIDGLSSVTVEFPVNTSVLEEAIKAELFLPSSCGLLGDTKCSEVVKVAQIGEHLAFFFIGEMLNEGATISFDGSNLMGFKSELFLGGANDVVAKNSDVVYANLELLEIVTGSANKVVNVRGLSSVATELNRMNGNGDFVFISSEANEIPPTASYTDFLAGWLDYLEGNLIVRAGKGRNRLMISDENSTIPKGTADAPMRLSRDALVDIRKGVLGDIMYYADEGDWSRGIEIFLGKGDDIMGSHIDRNRTISRRTHYYQRPCKRRQ